MSAVADLQNTVVKEFADDPRVETAIVSQVDPIPVLETFWRNVYLRGQMLYDPTSDVGGLYYEQPYGGIPFSRGWIIGPTGTVIEPVFGHKPGRVIHEMHDQLGDPACPDVTTTCLELSPGPELRIARGACGSYGFGSLVDVVRGDLGTLQRVGGSVDLGAIACVANGVARNRITETSAVSDPSCDDVPAVFFLAKAGASVDYGSASTGETRDLFVPGTPCY